MTRIQNKPIEEITEVLMKNGFEQVMPQVMEIMLNSAMKSERGLLIKDPDLLSLPHRVG